MTKLWIGRPPLADSIAVWKFRTGPKAQESAVGNDDKVVGTKYNMRCRMENLLSTYVRCTVG